MPLPILPFLFIIAHITAAANGHPINCVKHNFKDEVVCEYKLNR